MQGWSPSATGLRGMGSQEVLRREMAGAAAEGAVRSTGGGAGAGQSGWRDFSNPIRVVKVVETRPSRPVAGELPPLQSLPWAASTPPL